MYDGCTCRDKIMSLKVLMIGWEYPPLINGGLGIACHGISVSLTEFANVTLLLPVASKKIKEDKLKILGLNADTTKSNYFSQNRYAGPLYDVKEIPADLDPYFTDSTPFPDILNYKVKDEKNTLVMDVENPLYQGNMYERIHQFACAAEEISRNIDFDLIHIHDWMTIPAGLRIKHTSGKPLVLHIHSLETDRSGDQSKGWVYQLERAGMNLADLMISVSHFTSKNIELYYGIEKRKIKTVHNGSQSITEIRRQKKSNEKIVVFVGRITRQKGPELFLDIAEKVFSRNNLVRFVMAGTGDILGELIEKSAVKTISDKIHFTGFLDSDKIKDLLSLADVYCMPSLSEPFGLSAIEAAQCDVPCVLSRQSGVSEVLRASLLFDWWDVNRAASLILSVLNCDILHRQLICDARRDIQSVSWKLSAQEIINAYRNSGVINRSI